MARVGCHKLPRFGLALAARNCKGAQPRLTIRDTLASFSLTDRGAEILPRQPHHPKAPTKADPNNAEWQALRPTGSDLSTDVVSVSFLFWASDPVAARTVSTTLSMADSVMFRVNWPDSILAMSSTVLIRPSKCLPLARMRVRASRDFGFCGS